MALDAPPVAPPLGSGPWWEACLRAIAKGYTLRGVDVVQAVMEITRDEAGNVPPAVVMNVSPLEGALVRYDWPRLEALMFGRAPSDGLSGSVDMWKQIHTWPARGDCKTPAEVAWAWAWAPGNFDDGTPKPCPIERELAGAIVSNGPDARSPDLTTREPDHAAGNSLAAPTTAADLGGAASSPGSSAPLSTMGCGVPRCEGEHEATWTVAGVIMRRCHAHGLSGDDLKRLENEAAMRANFDAAAGHTQEETLSRPEETPPTGISGRVDTSPSPPAASKAVPRPTERPDPSTGAGPAGLPVASGPAVTSEVVDLPCPLCAKTISVPCGPESVFPREKRCYACNGWIRLVRRHGVVSIERDEKQPQGNPLAAAMPAPAPMPGTLFGDVAPVKAKRKRSTKTSPNAPEES